MYVQMTESNGFTCLDWFVIAAMVNFYQDYLCINPMVGTSIFLTVCGNFMIRYLFMLGLTALLSLNRISKRRQEKAAFAPESFKFMSR